MSEGIVNLNDGQPVDPTRLLRGAWRSFQIRGLGPASTTELVSEGAEHAAYILRGRGTARSGDEVFPVDSGTGITIPEGDRVLIEAGSEPMELFVCTLEA